MADIDNCDGSNYLRRACDAGTGGGGGGGGSEFNKKLTNGDGIGILDYDGSVARTIAVNSSVVRNTTDQVIAGGLTVEKLISNGPITGQGLDVSGVFTVEGDGSVGGSAPAATNVIAWNGAQWAPATAGGAASSSNLDLGYALNQSLRTSDEGQLNKLDVTGATGLLSSGRVGIGTTDPDAQLEIMDSANGATVTGLKLTNWLANNNSEGVSLVFGGHDTDLMGSIESRMRNIDARSDLIFSTNSGASATDLGERMRIASNGNVGIGTADPFCDIEAKAKAGNEEVKLGLASADGTQNAAIAHVSGDSNPRLSFRVGGFGPALEKLAVLNDGNVGIGTTEPSIRLSVATDDSAQVGSFISTDSTNVGGRAKVAHIENNTAGGAGTLIGLNVDITGAATSTKYAAILNGGHVGIGTTEPSKILSVEEEIAEGASLSSFSNTADEVDSIVGIDFQTSEGETNRQRSRILGGADGSDGGYLAFHTRTTGSIEEAVRMDSDGRVGIGTTNPVSPLQVHNTDGGTVARFTRSGDSFGSSYLLAVTELANENAQLDMQNNGGLSKIRLSTSGINYFDGADGKLGIGTTDPDSKLEVDYDFDEFNPLVNIYNRATSTGKGLRVRAGNDTGDYIATFVTRSAIDALHIAGNTQVGIGTTNPDAQLEIMDSANGATVTGLKLTNWLANNNSEGVSLVFGGHDTDLMGSIESRMRNIDARSDLIFSTNSGASATDLGERMRIASNGNVGIGTSAPAGIENGQVLHISGSSAADLRLASSARDFSLYAGSTNLVIRNNNTASDDFVINNSGYVGIGTSTPIAKLSLPTSGVGASHADGITLGNSANTHGLNIWSDQSGHTVNYFDSVYNGADSLVQFRMKTAGTPIDAMTIKGDGNVGIGTTEPSTSLEVHTPNGGGIALYGATNIQSGWRLKPFGNDLQMVQNHDGGERMTLQAGGNVGIGTISPTGKLEIGGAGEGIVLQTPDGTKKYLVTVDNGGNLTTAEV